MVVLESRLNDCQLGFFLSAGLALLSGVPLLFAHDENLALFFVGIGVVLCMGTGRQALALRRDLYAGVRTVRGRVTTFRRLFGREIIVVKTARGYLRLANRTGQDALHLTRGWHCLTYAAHSAMLLSAEAERTY
jgi:hypothetical protein